MTTYGERFEAEIDNELAAAWQMTERHYSAEEVRGRASTAGTRLELFLKGVAFPASDAQENLNHFIDRLSAQGVGAQTIDALHDLRREYNRAKHDPAISRKVRRCRDLDVGV